MSANEHDDDQPDSFEVIERLRAKYEQLDRVSEAELMACEKERDEAIRQSQGYLKGARELLEERDALRVRVAKLEAVLREARGWVVNFDNADNYQRGATLARIDAALKGTPQ